MSIKITLTVLTALVFAGDVHAESSDAPTQRNAGTHRFPAFPVEPVRAFYDSTYARFAGDKRYSAHEYADYFKALFELSDRLIGAAKQDALSEPKNSFIRFEVDRQAYQARELLCRLAQELDLIDYNAARVAVYAANTVNIKRTYGAVGDGVNNDHGAFRAALTAIQAAGVPSRLFIPAGQYRLDAQWATAHLYLLNQKDLIIEGEPGTVLILPRKLGIMEIKDCQNIQLRNLTFDFRPVSFSQGKVTAIDFAAGTVDLTLYPGYENPTIAAYTSADFYQLWVMNSQTGLVKHDQRKDFTIQGVQSLQGGVYRFKIAGENNLIGLGDLCAIIPRNNGAQVPALPGVGKVSGFRSFNSRFITLADTRVYGAQHYFFMPLDKTDGLKILRTSFERMPGTNRLACNLADGITGHDLARAPYIESCRIASTYDDCTHFSSAWRTVLSVDGNKLLIDARDAFGLPDPALYPVGGMVAIGDLNAMKIRDYGMIVWAETVSFGGAQKVRLTLDRSPSGVVAEGRQGVGKTVDAIFSLAFSCSGQVVRNSFLGLNRANGIRLRAPNAIIENNVFALHAGSTVLREWSGDSEQPGLFPSHQIFRQNTVYNTQGIIDQHTGSDGSPVLGVPVRYCIEKDNRWLPESQFGKDYPHFYWKSEGPPTLNYGDLLQVIGDQRRAADIFR